MRRVLIQTAGGFEGPGAAGVDRQRTLAGVDAGVQIVLGAIDDNLDRRWRVSATVAGPDAVEDVRALDHAGVAASDVNERHIIHDGDGGEAGCQVAIDVGCGDFHAVDGKGVVVAAQGVLELVGHLDIDGVGTRSQIDAGKRQDDGRAGLAGDGAA